MTNWLSKLILKKYVVHKSFIYYKLQESELFLITSVKEKVLNNLELGHYVWSLSYRMVMKKSVGFKYKNSDKMPSKTTAKQTDCHQQQYEASRM